MSNGNEHLIFSSGGDVLLSLVGFLMLLFKYTFKQTSVENFQTCLEICEDFLDHAVSNREKLADVILR